MLNSSSFLRDFIQIPPEYHLNNNVILYTAPAAVSRAAEDESVPGSRQLWMITGVMISMLYKFIDLSDNRLRALYMEYIVKPDNEIGNAIPVKQAEDFFALLMVEYFIGLDTEYQKMNRSAGHIHVSSGMAKSPFSFSSSYIIQRDI
jgi:hypothetical protein